MERVCNVQGYEDDQAKQDQDDKTDDPLKRAPLHAQGNTSAAQAGADPRVSQRSCQTSTGTPWARAMLPR